MVELYDIVATTREVDTLVDATEYERSKDYNCNNSDNDTGFLALSQEVNLSVGKEVAAEACCKCHIFVTRVLQQSFECQT